MKSTLIRTVCVSLLVVCGASAMADWPVFYHGPGNSAYGQSIVTDSEGNVFVAINDQLSTGSDWRLSKYNRLGNLKWSRGFDGPAHGYDYTSAIDVDASGNVFLTGSVTTASSTTDMQTISYDLDGNVRWSKRYDGNGMNDNPNRLKADGTGGCVIAGSSDRDGGRNFAVIKYASDGSKAWAKQFSSEGYCNLFGLALSAVGDVFVTGQAAGPGGSYDMTTIKYASDGTRKWVKTFDGSNGDDSGNAVGVDANGDAYVAGRSWNGTRYNFVTVKYSNGGVKLWQNRKLGQTDDYPYGMAVAPDGGVYVSGTSNNSLGNYTDVLTMKIDQTSGDTLWANKIHDDVGTNLTPTAPFYDASGVVYVAASESTGAHAKIVIGKYSSAGPRIYLQTIEDAQLNYAAAAATLDPFLNKFYVTGYSYDPATSELSMITVKF